MYRNLWFVSVSQEQTNLGHFRWIKNQLDNKAYRTQTIEMNKHAIQFP